ncbi:MAG: hypothetical protein QXN01_04570 [Candidatus Anstonellales archaeon]
MAWIFENEYNEDGSCISHREGRLGEATCPKCGYPVLATFWSDGEVEVELCYDCKSQVKRKEVSNE